MHVVGYSSIYKYSVVKYLRENIGQERCIKKWGYACLAGTADSRDQQAAAVDPRLPTLPKHKQYNKTEINNHDHIMICTSRMIWHFNATKITHKFYYILNEAFPKAINYLAYLMQHKGIQVAKQL